MAVTTPWSVHAVVTRSRANGPGPRLVIWSQGCSLACPGCFNPATHAPGGAASIRPVAEFVELALAESADIEGVTLTGGEPLEQPAAVAAFCRRVKARSALGIVVLTGFTPREIQADRERRAAVADTDMVIAGRYNRHRHLGAGLRGSDNKVYWARTSRYRPADFAAVPPVEVIVAVDGTVVVTGLPDTVWEIA